MEDYKCWTRSEESTIENPPKLESRESLGLNTDLLQLF